MPVVISGTKEALAALRKFQPEAAKALTKEVKAAATPIVSKAKGYAPSDSPLSGWTRTTGKWGSRAYVASDVKSGIGFSSKPTKPNNNGFSYTAYIYNKSAAGAIYETAGRKNPQGQKWDRRNSSNKFSHSINPNAGKDFILALGSIGTGKSAGRLIFRAWNEDNGKALRAIARAYDLTVDRFNRGEF